MSHDVIIASRAFRIVECFKCGVEFGVPRGLDETWPRDKQEFWCPNGHGQHYTTSLRDTLEQTRRDLGEALAARDAAEKKVAAMRDRAKAGLCQFCRRSFVNVQRHMATKHGGKA